MNCPEAPFPFLLGQFTENSLAANTVQEVVDAVVAWVNISQGFPDFVATDLGNGVILFQIDWFNFAGYDYCNCSTGITAEGIDLYWNWNPNVAVIDHQDSNELSFHENWSCTGNEAGDSICLGTLTPQPGGDTCEILICNDVLVPCQGGEPSATFSVLATDFELDGNTNTLVPNQFFYSFADDSQLDFQLAANDFYMKERAILPCCNPSSLRMQILNAAWGGGTAIISQPSPDQYRIDLSNGSWVLITCVDFQVPLPINSPATNWVAPYYISNPILIHGDSPTGQANFTVDDETLTFEVNLSGDCIPAGLSKIFYIA
jgi:hypothetical protein